MNERGFVYDYIGAHDPETYEKENSIADPDQRIERFMEGLSPLDGAGLADIGAGSGYHACRFARRAAHVFAVEPAPLMLRLLYARLAASEATNVSVVAAAAHDTKLRDELVDVVHSRFAYFFGPEQRDGVRTCEPGIQEAMRILKPGGWFFIIDNALTSGEFAEILARHGYSQGCAAAMQEANDRFYTRHGFSHATVESSWSAPDREALQRVLGMSFGADAAQAIMDEVHGAGLSYHYRIYYQQKRM